MSSIFKASLYLSNSMIMYFTGISIIFQFCAFFPLLKNKYIMSVFCYSCYIYRYNNLEPLKSLNNLPEEHFQVGQKQKLHSPEQNNISRDIFLFYEFSLEKRQRLLSDRFLKMIQMKLFVDIRDYYSQNQKIILHRLNSGRNVETESKRLRPSL